MDEVVGDLRFSESLRADPFCRPCTYWTLPFSCTSVFAFSYKFFYLLLQVLAVLGAIPMVFVKTVVFPFIAHIRRRV